MTKTAWIFSYKLKKSVTPEEFMDRTQKLHDKVISQAKGFLSWAHYVQDETWTERHHGGTGNGGGGGLLRLHPHGDLPGPDLPVCEKILRTRQGPAGRRGL